MHADSLDHAVKRLTSPPMNVSEIYIPLMNLCIYIARVDLPQSKGGLSFGRRIRNVWEVVDYGNYTSISEWDPITDTFKTDFSKSFLLQKIASLKGLDMNNILNEVKKRKVAVRKMVQLSMNPQEVAQAIVNYYEGQPIEAAKKQKRERALRTWVKKQTDKKGSPSSAKYHMVETAAVQLEVNPEKNQNA